MRSAVAMYAVSNSPTVASPSCLAVFLPKIYSRRHQCQGVKCCEWDVIDKAIYFFTLKTVAKLNLHVCHTFNFISEPIRSVSMFYLHGKAP